MLRGLAESAVAYKERSNLPVIHDEVERQQREEIRYRFQESGHYSGLCRLLDCTRFTYITHLLFSTGDRLFHIASRRLPAWCRKP
ncbi:DNA polymerase III subunit theta [Pantoea sp. R102]|uniref:DNA polymerase III subunit theta n=1 Tax=Pantoea sp. R102 TaxID=2507583 RepID=UPI0010A91FB9|nr:DNA polymerase III subunit theta [Pantoea sp. R102]THD40144.1 hypothetical protein ERD80_05710 [Pantoea sp. R102]